MSALWSYYSIIRPMPNRVQYKNQTVLKVLRYSGDIQFRSWGDIQNLWDNMAFFNGYWILHYLQKRTIYSIWQMVQFNIHMSHPRFILRVFCIKKLKHAHLHCFTNPIKKSEFTIICRKSWNIGKLCFLASSKMPFPIKTSYLQLYIVSTASCSKLLNSPHWWAVDMSLLLTYIGAHTRHIWDDTHLMCPSEIVSITAMFYPINTMAICSVHIVGMAAIYIQHWNWLRQCSCPFLSTYRLGWIWIYFLLQGPSILFTFDYPF